MKSVFAKATADSLRQNFVVMPAEALAKAGGAERARTADPLVANQVLSQLSYSPIEYEGRRLGSLPSLSSKPDTYRASDGGPR